MNGVRFFDSSPLILKFTPSFRGTLDKKNLFKVSFIYKYKINKKKVGRGGGTRSQVKNKKIKI
jgi:hypothetical protein